MKRQKQEEFEEKQKRQIHVTEITSLFNSDQINNLKQEVYEKQKQEEDKILKDYFRSKETAKKEKAAEDELDRTLKLSWSTALSYDEEQIRHLFSQYGEIENIVISLKKKGSALIVFKRISFAVTNVVLISISSLPLCVICKMNVFFLLRLNGHAEKHR